MPWEYPKGGESMNNIASIRQKIGMTQSALAQKAEISQPYLHDLEKDRRGARLETWARIADALGVTVADVMGVDDDGRKAAEA